jgi:hypothetical protein
MKHHLTFLLTLACSAGCDNSVSQPDDPVGSRAAPGPVTFIALPQGTIVDPWDSDLDSTRAVVRTTSEWTALWSGRPPRYPPPPIDYRTQMLLVAASGPRGGHGWTIRIDSARVQNDTVIAHVREYSSCATTGAIVNPIHVTAMERHDGPVVFRNAGTTYYPCP